jgi:hypothetical protein
MAGFFRRVFGSNDASPDPEGETAAGQPMTAPVAARRPATAIDPHGQPLNRQINAFRITDRAIDELIGLCRGVLADGMVTDGEAAFLAQWMETNRGAAAKWPAKVLYPRIRAMLCDGTLDADEQGELLDLLMKTTGGGLSSMIGAESMSSELPLDEPAPEVVFKGRTFCLTGRFVYGPRKRCEAEILERGGEVRGVPSRSTRYVVVGAVGSSDWIHSTHGRKIETAIRFREEGAQVAIVSEEHWTQYL